MQVAGVLERPRYYYLNFRGSLRDPGYGPPRKKGRACLALPSKPAFSAGLIFSGEKVFNTFCTLFSDIRLYSLMTFPGGDVPR